jgi:GHMP kinases C terminal
MMSGSGSTVFALCETKDEAEAIQTEIALVPPKSQKYMLESNSSIDYDDDLIPEIDINQIQPEKLVRGKHYQAIQKHGYSVTVHHEDGTSTYREVKPEEVAERMKQREEYKKSSDRSLYHHQLLRLKYSPDRQLTQI